MPEYEFRAFATAKAATPEQAERTIEEFFGLAEFNGCAVSLDDGEPDIVDEED